MGGSGHLKSEYSILENMHHVMKCKSINFHKVHWGQFLATIGFDIKTFQLFKLLLTI